MRLVTGRPFGMPTIHSPVVSSYLIVQKLYQGKFTEGSRLEENGIVNFSEFGDFLLTLLSVSNIFLTSLSAFPSHPYKP